MTAPDKIYVHEGAHLGMLTLTTIPVGAPGEEIYIRKDALMEWAKDSMDSLGRLSYGEFIDKLNSM